MRAHDEYTHAHSGVKTFGNLTLVNMLHECSTDTENTECQTFEDPQVKLVTLYHSYSTSTNYKALVTPSDPSEP